MDMLRRASSSAMLRILFHKTSVWQRTGIVVHDGMNIVSHTRVKRFTTATQYPLNVVAVLLLAIP